MPEQAQDNPIYKFMKSNNLTKLDEKTFLDKYSTPEKAKEIYSFMASNKLTDLDDVKFYDKYLKKKDQKQEVLPSVSSPSNSQSSLPDFKKGKAFAERGFLMQSDGTRAPKEEVIKPVEKQGLILNTVSALDRGFYKNFISSPIKGLGTALQGATKKALGGTGEGFISDKLIQFGDYLNKTIDELTPQDEEFKGTLTDQVSQAFGQVGSVIMTGGLAGAGKGAASVLMSEVPKGAALTAVKALGSQLSNPAAVSAGLSMGQAEFDRAKEAGANDDQAFEAFYKNAATGSVLETIPVMQFFKRFNNSTGGSVANYIKTKGVAGLTGGIEEMATEVMQQIYSNKTAKDIYNINQDILDGVGSSGGIGFGVGFVLNAMGANAKILRKQGKIQEANVLENQVKQFEDNLENPKVTSDKKAVAKDIVTQGIEIGTQKAVQSLDRDLANNVITPEQYQEGIVFTEKAAQVVDKIPETVTGESKVESVELLVERNDIKEANQVLLQQKQTTDEAYHAGIDEEIKANEERIKKIDSEVYNIAKKPSKEFGTKKYIVDGEEVSKEAFEALQGKPIGTKEVVKPENAKIEKAQKQLDVVEKMNPNAGFPLFNVGQVHSDGNKYTINKETDSRTNPNAEGVVVISKVIEPAQVDENGKMTKTATVETTIFDSKEDAQGALQDNYNKYKAIAEERLATAQGEANPNEEVTVYHGGSVKDLSKTEGGLFVSADKAQAEAYAKGNSGDVQEFKINKKDISNENEVRNIIVELGLKSKQEGWDLSKELMLHEILDPRFETSLSDKDLAKLNDELVKRGFKAIEMSATDVTGREFDTNDILVLNPKETLKSEVKPTEVKQPTKELAEGEEVTFNTPQGDKLTGEKVTVPGFEKIDMVLVKDGLNNTVYDLASGTPLAEGDFAKENAIKSIKEQFDAKNITQGKIYNLIYKSTNSSSLENKNRVPKINPSSMFESYSEKRKAFEKEEYEKLPLKFNPEEIKKLKELKKKAEDFGIDKMAKEIEEAILSRAKEGSVKPKTDYYKGLLQRRIDDKVKKEAEDKGVPYPEEYMKQMPRVTMDKLKTIVNEGFKRDKFESIPEDVRKIILDGYQKNIDILNKYGYYPDEKTKVFFDKLYQYVAAQTKRENRESQISEAKKELITALDYLNKAHEKEFGKKAEGEVKVYNAKDLKENPKALEEDADYDTVNYPKSFDVLYTSKETLNSKNLGSKKIGDVINIFNKDYVISDYPIEKNQKVKLIRVDKEGNILRREDTKGEIEKINYNDIVNSPKIFKENKDLIVGNYYGSGTDKSSVTELNKIKREIKIGDKVGDNYVVLEVKGDKNNPDVYLADIDKDGNLIRIEAEEIEIEETEEKVTKDDLKKAEAKFAAAEDKFKKARNKVESTQVKQSGIFGGEQKGMFAMGGTEAKSTLDPLRKASKEAKSELDNVKNRIKVQEEAQTELAPVEPPKKTYQEAVKEKLEADKKQNRKIGAEKATVTKEVYRRVSEMDAPVDAEQVALRYFADGGKVSKDAVDEAYGSVKRAQLNVKRKELLSEEVKSKDFVQGKETLDETAHRLWEANDQRIPERDIKDRLMAEIGNNNTRLEAAEAYLDKYNAEYKQEKEELRMAELYKEQYLEEQAEIEKELRSPLDEQIEGEASEEHINNLINQYEAEIKGEDQQSRPASEAETNREASKGKVAEKNETKLAKDYKEAVGKASKKAKENAKKDFVERNFDNIVEKLKIQIKCPT